MSRPAITISPPTAIIKSGGPPKNCGNNRQSWGERRLFPCFIRKLFLLDNYVNRNAQGDCFEDYHCGGKKPLITKKSSLATSKVVCLPLTVQRPCLLVHRIFLSLATGKAPFLERERELFADRGFCTLTLRAEAGGGPRRRSRFRCRIRAGRRFRSTSRSRRRESVRVPRGNRGACRSGPPGTGNACAGGI